MKGRFPFCWLLLCLWAPAVLGADVRDVRLWRAPDHTRIVFDLSAPVEHKLIRLKAPERIVVDLSDSTLQVSLDKLDLAKTPVRRIRHGAREDAGLRFVLDLSSSVKPRSFILKANDKRGDRLVLDLYDLKHKEARPTVKKSMASSARRDIVIAIDAGHGGEDPGATGPKRQREKHVVLAIARDVHGLLQRQSGYKPELIRTGDYYIGLKRRRDLAHEKQADLLVSIHADAFKSPKARGTSVYTLSPRGASSSFAKFLAERENSADLVGGVSLSDKDDLLAQVLYDMSMSHTLDASLGLGSRVLGEMDQITRLHRREVEQAAFVVLKSPDIPSVLIETGFISNPDEARLLATRDYQRKMARAIHAGIISWFDEHPPADTLIAARKRSSGHEYVISLGDTLSEIAQRFNVSVASLRQHNDLSGSVIRVGQKLIIPAS